jgi:hypothetical protein
MPAALRAAGNITFQDNFGLRSIGGADAHMIENFDDTSNLSCSARNPRSGTVR